MVSLGRREYLGVGLGLGVGALAVLGWRHVTYRFPGESVRRGAGDSLRRTEVVEDDDVAYSADRRVEVVVARRGGDPAETESLPFGEWARARARESAAEAVREHLAAALDADEPLPGLTRNAASGTLRARVGVPSGEHRTGVVVEYVHRTDDGELAAKPPVDYATVVARAPLSVTATVELAGHTHTSTVPVWVWRVEEGPVAPG